MKISGQKVNFNKMLSVAFLLLIAAHAISLVIFMAGGVTERVYSEICFVGMSFFYWQSVKSKGPGAKPTPRELMFFTAGCVLFIAGEIIAH